jgi:hypothetical protein
MSGEWIKLRLDLGDDPAVIAISAMTRLHADEVIGKLYRLWAWADRHTRDGLASGVGEGWVDSFVGKRGFAAAMADAGWLEVSDNEISFPHFDRHNGQTAKTRALDQKRKQVERQTGRRAYIPPDKRHATNRTETGQTSDKRHATNRTETGQTSDESRTREEKKKRREDQKQDQKKKPRAARAKPAPKVAMPTDFGISDRVRDWAADKGHTDLLAHLEAFRGYALRNSKVYADWDEAFMSAIREDWGHLREAKPSAREPTRAERRAANMDNICGRTPHGRTFAGELGGAPFCALPGDLRIEGEPDVGRPGEGRPDRNLE